MGERDTQQNIVAAKARCDIAVRSSRAVFLTNWAYVDHLLSRRALGRAAPHATVGEVYYVLNGDGDVTVNSETAAIRKGDASLSCPTSRTRSPTMARRIWS